MAITKSDVHRFAPGTAEYVVMHARWRVSRGRRNPTSTFSWLKNPSKALAWAKKHAYFPVSRLYLEGKVPENYVCGKCGAGGVKLWRDCMDLALQPLLCLSCACREQKKVRTPTEDGRLLYTDEVHHWYRTENSKPGCWDGYNSKEGVPSDAIETRTDHEKTDQIGWLVPAVPTEENDICWINDSVPNLGAEWWYKLPTVPADNTH